jgi:hypothetical protein
MYIQYNLLLETTDLPGECSFKAGDYMHPHTYGINTLLINEYVLLHIVNIKI